MSTNANYILEVVIFSLKSEVGEKEFLELSKEVHVQFLSQQKGFIKRALSKTQDGKYIDVVYWESIEKAHKAMENSMQSEIVGKWAETMDAGSMQMYHTTPILTNDV